MARIRTIQPNFAHSNSIMHLSRDARLLFVQLWTVVDDCGRARWSLPDLASRLYPLDDDAPALLPGWLDELEREGCLERYTVDEVDYLRVVNWNPGAEGGGRDAALDQTVGQINAATAMLAAPQNVAVQAIAIQEANQGTNGDIFTMLAAQAGVAGTTFEHFTRYHISEHHVAQAGRVGRSKGYIVALRTGGASPVVPVAPAANMIGG